MKLYPLIFCLLVNLLTIFNVSGYTTNESKKNIDLVFCLDLSGSTNGLINDVRDNLWTILNNTNLLQPDAHIRVAVVGFSRPSFGKNNAYVRVLCDLTNDFDHVAGEMYRLKPSIEKGDQIVSAALNTCVFQLNWTKDINAKKIVFLAGNGAVSANGIEYVKACEEAAERNIIINSVYIPNGSNMIKELPAWRRIATITGGTQSEITINKTNPDITWININSEKIKQLNKNLNASYHWSGKDSAACRKEQFTADSGAYYAGSENFSQRLYFKSTERYQISLSNCELTLQNQLSTSITNSESGEINTNQFELRIQEIKLARNNFIEEIKKELPIQNLNLIHAKYQNNEIADKNIFTRVVINMLRLQLK